MNFQTLYSMYDYKRRSFPLSRNGIGGANIVPLRELRKKHIEEKIQIISVSQTVFDSIREVIDESKNSILNLRIFVDYISYKLREVLLPSQLAKLDSELEVLLNEKTERYFCAWDNMINLLLEYTSLRIVASAALSSPIVLSPNRSIFMSSPSTPANLSKSTTKSSYSHRIHNINEKSGELLVKSLFFDPGVSDRIEKAMKEKGFALKESAQWPSDDDNSTNIVTQLIQARKSSLSPEENNKCDNVLNGPRTQEYMISKFAYDMTREQLLCLRSSTWLNDQVINFYFQELQERDNKLCEAFPSRKKSWYFSSFFMEKLLETDGRYNYANVKRWTKKIDIFSLDKVFFPINIGNTHWTLGVAYMQKKEVHYFDSMNGGGKKYLDAMVKWIVDDGNDKKSLTVNPNEYKRFSQHPNTPQQRNGVDCGVFTTVCADFLSDNLPINETSYSQSEMNFFRRRILANILQGTLNYPLLQANN